MAGLTFEGFVQDLERANIAVVVICVDDVDHPFEELVGTFVLVINVKASGGGALSTLNISTAIRLSSFLAPSPVRCRSSQRLGLLVRHGDR